MSVAKSFGFVLVMSVAPIGSGIGAPTRTDDETFRRAANAPATPHIRDGGSGIED